MRDSMELSDRMFRFHCTNKIKSLGVTRLLIFGGGGLLCELMFNFSY